MTSGKETDFLEEIKNWANIKKQVIVAQNPMRTNTRDLALCVLDLCVVHAERLAADCRKLDKGVKNEKVSTD